MKVRGDKYPERKFTGITPVMESKYRFWNNLYDPLQWVDGNMAEAL